jgi:signal transduction histidine kinase
MTFVTALARRDSVVHQLTIRLGMAGLCIAVLLAVIVVIADYRISRQRAEARFQQIESGYLASIRENVWLQDGERLRQLVEGIRQFPNVQLVQVLDEDGTVLAESGALADKDDLRNSFPLSRGYLGRDIAIGRLDVSMSLGEIRRPVLQRAWLAFVGNIILMAGILGVLYWQVYRLVTHPLSKMADHVRHMDLERTDFAPPLKTSLAELKELDAAYRDMRQTIDLGYHAIQSREEHLRILFDNSPVSLWEEDFSQVKAELDELRAHYTGRIEDYLAANPHFVEFCASLVAVVRVNDATLALHTATSQQDLLGKLTKTFTPASMGAFARQIVAIWNGEAHLSVESEVKTLDGRTRQVVVHWSVPPGHGDRLDRVLVALENITDRKAAEHALADSLDRLINTNRELERLTEIAAHDLQEPMRNIVSFSQLLERKLGAGLDSEGRELFEFLAKAARRTQEQMSGLLAYAQAAPLGTPLSPTPLDKALQAATARLRSEIAGREAIVESGRLPSVLGNAELLADLFHRLLDNALKFHHADTKPRVSITATVADGMAWVAVSDCGIGILPSYADTVFQIFKRLHGPEEYGGIGVGLAICRKLVERQGGKIWVDTSVSEGCTIRFTLPAAP